MYVSLWYKFGKPVHGYSWNDGGVVQASFPYGSAELSGKNDLGGMIQVRFGFLSLLVDNPTLIPNLSFEVLQYKGDHNSLGYWYDWIKYGDRFEKTDERQLVRCGQSMPILWANRPGGPLLGYLDMQKEEAYFAQNGKAEKITGKPLADMLIIVRSVFLNTQVY